MIYYIQSSITAGYKAIYGYFNHQILLTIPFINIHLITADIKSCTREQA